MSLDSEEFVSSVKNANNPGNKLGQLIHEVKGITLKGKLEKHITQSNLPGGYF